MVGVRAVSVPVVPSANVCGAPVRTWPPSEGHRHCRPRGERDRPRHRLRRVAVVGRIAVRNLAEPAGSAHAQEGRSYRRRRSARRGSCRSASNPDRDRQRRVRQVAVAVLDRVGEHVVAPPAVPASRDCSCSCRPRPASACRRRPGSACPASPHCQRSALVLPAATPDHRPVGAQNVNAAHRRGRPNRRDHVAGLRRELTHAVACRVGMRRRHVVDDVDHQVAGRRAVAVGIRHHHRKARSCSTDQPAYCRSAYSCRRSPRRRSPHCRSYDAVSVPVVPSANVCGAPVRT